MSTHENPDGGRADALAVFQEHRDMLFGIAYRMLGQVADAEDLVQDTWLRWSRVTEPVDNPAAYLTRIITNLSLTRLTSATARREQYVGPWLPEPLVTGPGAAEEVEVSESVSLAMLVVLESLSPLERAVFVLKEVFGFSYAEIAADLERSEAAVRQVGHRARAAVRARRPRYDATAEERRRVTDQFMAASAGGDLNRMLELLAPDVTLWSDGGGKVQAARRPLHGADRVIRFLEGVRAKQRGEVSFHAVDVNGHPGVRIDIDGRTDNVVVCEVDRGRITEIRLVRNPDKLRHLQGD